MKVKEFLFGLWGTFWVYVDEIRKALNAMSATEFLKFTGKVFLYSLSAIGWLLILATMWVML